MILFCFPYAKRLCQTTVNKKRRKIARVSIPDENKEHKHYKNFDNVKPRVTKLSLSFCEVYQHVYKVVFKYFIKPLFIYINI